MKREIVLAGLAMLALIASAAPAGAQFFGEYAYGGWDGRSCGFRSHATGSYTCAKRYRPARVSSHRGISGFYLVGSPYDTADHPYNCHCRGYASTGFGSPVNDWWRHNSRIPMH
jgi:hypothetical protein